MWWAGGEGGDLGVAALLVANEHKGDAAHGGQPAHHGRVVQPCSVAMQLHKPAQRQQLCWRATLDPPKHPRLSLSALLSPPRTFATLNISIRHVRGLLASCLLTSETLEQPHEQLCSLICCIHIHLWPMTAGRRHCDTQELKAQLTCR